MDFGHVFSHGDPGGEHFLAVGASEVFGLLVLGVQGGQLGVHVFYVAHQRRFRLEPFSTLFARERPRPCVLVHVLLPICLARTLPPAFLASVLLVPQMSLFVPLEVGYFGESFRAMLAPVQLWGLVV